MNIYQRTYLEEIWSIFDQVVPVVSYLEFYFPDKSLAPKQLVNLLEVVIENSVKNTYLRNMIRTKMSTFFWIP